MRVHIFTEDSLEGVEGIRRAEPGGGGKGIPIQIRVTCDLDVAVHAVEFEAVRGNGLQRDGRLGRHPRGRFGK